MNAPSLLIFDLDGTLIDSRADLAAGINHMRAHYDLASISLETITGYVGNGVRSLVERSLQGAEVDVDEALQINKDYYFSHLTVHTYLYEGVKEGLQKLIDAGNTLAILTNKPGDPTRTILQEYGLASFFSVVIGGGDIENLKPAPDGILEILETTNIPAEQAWMVGDNYTDLAAAERANIKSIFVHYGFGDAHEYVADLYFDTFSAFANRFL